jgi:hypothetical protein
MMISTYIMIRTHYEHRRKKRWPGSSSGSRKRNLRSEREKREWSCRAPTRNYLWQTPLTWTTSRGQNTGGHWNILVTYFLEKATIVNNMFFERAFPFSFQSALCRDAFVLNKWY